MKRRLGTVCLGLGAALIFAALSLLLWNRQEDARAGAAAERVLPQVAEEIAAAAETACPDPYDPEMTEVELDGYGYIGYLAIPELELELPVMAQWDYERLKIAPCRYTGSTKTGDLVLCAHNYDRHFGKIQSLPTGAEVTFSDMDGVVWRYQVAEAEILPPAAVEEMSSGDYELTLFTCTYGGQSRVTVRCQAVTKPR